MLNSYINKIYFSKLGLKIILFFLFSVLKIGCIFSQLNKNQSTKFQTLPLITYSEQTNWAFGLVSAHTYKIHKKDTISRISNGIFAGAYTLKNQLLIAYRGNQFLHKEKYIINEELSYSSFPDRFWKVGNTSIAEEYETYSYQQFYLNALITRKIIGYINVGLKIDFQKLFKISSTENKYIKEYYGDLSNGYVTSGLGAIFSYDSRNNAFSPNKGTFLQIYELNFNKLFGSDYEFTNINIDFRKYLELSETNILALQFFSNINVGEKIPIRNLSGLGGQNILRGVYNARFQDKNSFAIQAEWRHSLSALNIPIINNWGVVVFGDVGDVFAVPKQLSTLLLKTTFGAGIRIPIIKKDRLNLRIDIGYNVFDNNFAPQIQIGEAF